MEDVRQAVLEGDLQLGKRPHISGPVHVSSTAQIVTTGSLLDAAQHIQIQESSSTSIAIGPPPPQQQASWSAQNIYSATRPSAQQAEVSIISFT